MPRHHNLGLDGKQFRGLSWLRQLLKELYGVDEISEQMEDGSVHRVDGVFEQISHSRSVAPARHEHERGTEHRQGASTNDNASRNASKPIRIMNNGRP